MKAKMRTLDMAYKEIKAADPESNISKYSLRQLMMSGVIPTVRVGRLRLVDMTVLDNYLQRGMFSDNSAETNGNGQISRVDLLPLKYNKGQ